jgi:hypothetical protein
MKKGSELANSYLSLYVHIVFSTKGCEVKFNRPEGTVVLSLFFPAMNRGAIVMYVPSGASD